MQFVAKLVGDGSKENPFRVNMPTYTLVDCNYGTGEAVIDVPEIDIPFDPKDKPKKAKNLNGVNHQVQEFTPNERGALQKHIRGRYGGRFAEFDAGSVLP